MGVGVCWGYTSVGNIKMRKKKELTENKKKNIFFIVFSSFLLVALLFTNKKENSLHKNSKWTFGKVIDIVPGRNKYIEYQYYVNGNLYEGSDPYNYGWPEHHRTGKPVLNKFYNVEYDSLNPKYAKIFIEKKSYFDYELPEINGIKTKGIIENISSISDNYIDLYIKYKSYNKYFSFRSRFHKDSLPCIDYSKCLDSEIDLMVVEKYPELNDVYFQSYDRTTRRISKLINK